MGLYGQAAYIYLYITNLHKLVEYCVYGALLDEMIRDRLVAGIKNTALSEKLLLKSDLTLEQVVTMVRQSEKIRRQQELLRGPSHAHGVTRELNAIKSRSSNKLHSRGQQVKATVQSAAPQPKCFWCGRVSHNSRRECPARNLTCNACGINRYFASVCLKKQHQNLTAVDDDYESVQDNVVFL
jgi:hypothetical protein